MKIKKWDGSAWVQDYPEVNVSSIVATGTPSSSTFLRGDGTWATPAGVDNYVNTTGDTMTGALSIGPSVTHPGNSTPTALAYGKLTGYGSFFVNADTDGSTTEYLYLTAGYANGSGASNEGMRIGYSENSLTWKGHRIFTDNYHPNADTLTTARTINVGTAASGTATSFNGSSNITIPINSVSESYLSWGGQNTVGYVTPVGMSLSNEHSANRLAFINGNSLYFEYSADAGATWTDYGYSATTKSQFCTTSVGVLIGRTSGEYTTNSRTRITLTAQDGTNTYVYTNPRKMLLEISSSGGMQVLVETRTGANYQSGGAWTTFGTYTLSGWSGWNDIPLVLGTLGGGTTQTGNNWQLRLTFIMTSKNTTYPTTAQVNKLRIFGENTWFMPSTLAGTNDLYSYDMSQNALFPAIVQGTRFTSTVATGTSPLTVTSTTAVTNLNADLLDGNHASAFAASVHTHNELSRRDSITYGLSALQWADISGAGGTGLNGAIINNPTNEWWHHLIMNHNNAAGYYVDIAAAFHSDDLYFRRNVAGTLQSWRKVWHDGNDGSGSTLDADLLDGQHGSYYAPLASPALTGTPTAPTAAGGTNTTQIATTQFVTSAVTSNINLGSNSITAGRLKLTTDGVQPNWEIFESSNKLSVQAIDGVTNPIYDIWHSGNDGVGSGLDADLLDGQHGSYYQPASTALTTSTSFGGDVSGTYNAIVVADDSHNHIISNVDGLQTALDGKVNTSAVGAANGVVPLNASSKINETYLPNFIFGGMRYISSIGTNTTAESLLDSAQSYVASNGGTVSGCYFIVSGTATVTITGGTDTNNGVTHTFSPGPINMTGEEGDNVFDTIDLEPGDWLILNDTWGPYFSTTYQRWSVVNNTYALVTTSAPGIMSAADKTKLDGIATNANNYSHPTDGANSTISNANGLVLSSITVNTLGHVTAVGSKTLAAADIPTLNQNTTGSAATLTTARTLTIGSTGKTFNGSANVSWSLGEIGAAATSHTHAISDVTNLQTSLDAKASASHIHGNISNTGTITGSNISIGTGVNILVSSDTNTIGKSTIAFSGSGTNFLRQDGTWQTVSLPGHTHAATDITSGTIATARLGTGTANTTTFLRGDNTWSTAGIATYSTATLYVKRIYSRTATSGATWTERYDAGTGAGTTISTTATWTAIALGYTPSTTTDDEQFLIEFSNNTSSDLEKGICMVGYGTFSSTAGMAVISYDAYETVESEQLKIAKYYAQWRLNGSNIEFRYGSKVVW